VGVLRQKWFRRLLAGQSVSNVGDTVLYLSLGIWAKDLTKSNAAAGAVSRRISSAPRATPCSRTCSPTTT
jgi:uncharacterized PurR-regulated membrane protein YhhQ (DUF165 family)